jgi:hypothetical protein
VIRGRVVAADTGLPLRRAQLTLGVPTGPPGSQPTVSTDEEGRFEFTELPAGRHILSASKTGYLTLSYGQRRPLETPRPLEVADGQVLDRIDFRLPKGGVIVARITDDVGDPLAGVFVQAEYYGFVQGQRRLTSGGNSRTDDLGEARMSGIPPGEYYVSADANFGGSSAVLDVSDSGRRYATTYHPGTLTVAQAQSVSLTVGQEAIVNFSLLSARAARVSGVLRRSDGSAPVGATLSLGRQITSGSMGSAVELLPNGNFSVPNLLPGEYTLSASPRAVPGATSDLTREYARMAITMAGVDVNDLVITTVRAAAFSGQVVFDSGPAPADIQPASLQIYGAFPESPLAFGRFVTNADWTFDVADLAGTGMLRLRAPVNGWFLKAVTIEGKDVTDTPVEFTGIRTYRDVQVVLTQKRSEVTGTVTDARNQPTTDYVVLVFPEDRSQWTPQSRFIGTGRPDQQGQFKISGLPPGRYLAAAIDYLATGQGSDPDLLERLQSEAIRLTLAEGESRSLGLKLTAY